MLYGRQVDLETIEALLESAREGHGRALMVEGDAGLGKTALLEEAGRAATDMTQIRTAGLEAESSLPFSALAELTGGLLGGLSTLPRPQAAAIEGALALAAPAPGARFAVCAGFLGLLVNAAAESPLLIIVDDAQWLDRASGECLGYAARRLDGQPIALLAAGRAGEPHSLSGPKIEQLTLAGLDPAAAQATLMDVDPTLPTQVAAALVDSAAGNPLALVELPALLTAEQRSGAEPLEHPLPPGASLQRAFDRRITQLPSDAREACLVAAAALTTSLRPIQAAGASLGLGKEGLETAERAGIVALSDERIDFAHPLLRGAVYRGGGAAERRRAHRALSE
ncbi:MAG: ATP-binding protein, partial [Solirubrobacterales bacterium]